MFGEKFFFVVVQFSSMFEILGVDGGFFFYLYMSNLFVEFVQIWWGCYVVDVYLGIGFVNEIDGFVWQEVVLDVMGCKICCGGDCFVGDGDFVVGFVLVVQIFKDFDGQGD